MSSSRENRTPGSSGSGSEQSGRSTWVRSAAAVAIEISPFVDAVAASGLVDAEELATLRAELEARTQLADAPTLADELVKSKRITGFQAAMLLQGRGEVLDFGDYVVTEKLGAGGMATVYKALHRSSGEVVALKVLDEEAAHSVETNYRFDREVQASAKMSHPNIVQSFDCSLKGDTSYLVMEYVDGPNLAQHIVRHGTLGVDVAVDYTLQCARGLAHAHEKRIVHRDIKPENLLLASDGTIKILDMGLARFDNAPKLGEKSDSAYRLTQLGVVLGTADFMAPEQSIDARRADYRSDIYAVGCTLYFLIQGKSPYGRGTAMATMMAHQTDPIPDLAEGRSDVPKALAKVFAKMVAKNPKQRQETMQDVILDLEEAMGWRGKKREVAAAKPSKITPIEQHNPDATTLVKQPRKRTVPATVGLVLGLGLGTAAWLFDWPIASQFVSTIVSIVPPLAPTGPAILIITGGAAGAIIGFAVNELV